MNANKEIKRIFFNDFNKKIVQVQSPMGCINYNFIEFSFGNESIYFNKEKGGNIRLGLNETNLNDKKIINWIRVNSKLILRSYYEIEDAFAMFN